MFASLRVALFGLATFAALPAVAQDAFPVTITHVYGDTVIPAQPERIVTWGWASHDAMLALGVVPVGIPYFSYGGDENGILSWDKAKIAELGVEMPAILDNSGSPPIEQIAALKPDLIIAVYSGITQEEYNLLSAIAPVVAYRDAPWGTPWRDTILLTGEAIGRKAEAEKFVADANQFISDEVAKRPVLAGKTFAAVAEYNGSAAVYAALDARTKFVEDLGLVLAPGVNKQDPAKGQSFFFSQSFEVFDRLDPDVLITFFETEAANAGSSQRPASQPRGPWPQALWLPSLAPTSSTRSRRRRRFPCTGVCRNISTCSPRQPRAQAAEAQPFAVCWPALP